MKGLGRKHPTNTHSKRLLIQTSHVCQRRCTAGRNRQVEEYKHKHTPQGYLAATDTYTRRYDNIIWDVPNKVKYVDDTLLYDHGIEAGFNHTWDYLKLCCDKGIIFNKNKFQFYVDSVEFASLKITSSGILPSDHILTAIQDFPTPKTLTDARWWFSLVNQVAWAYMLFHL